jgi:23S rRNA (cytosine1962-C5)-methyltransferase
LIVLDPPAFAKHVRSVDRAARGYKDINLRAMRRIRAGGILFTYSCSQPVSSELFRQIVFAAAADSGRSVRVIAQTGHAVDHPVDLYHPEGNYLKGLVLVVDQAR